MRDDTFVVDLADLNAPLFGVPRTRGMGCEPVIVLVASANLATGSAAIGAIGPCIAIYFAWQTVREQRQANVELHNERLSPRLFDIAETVE